MILGVWCDQGEGLLWPWGWICFFQVNIIIFYNLIFFIDVISNLTTSYQIMIKNHVLLIIKSILSNISRGIL